MASKEVIEKVESIVFEAILHGSHPRNVAEAAISTILTALKEPTPAMQLVVSANWGRRTWSEYQQVINASPLGEQSE